MGLSMGGSLCLRLAEQRPDEVAGLVLVNPAVHTERRDRHLLPYVRHVVKAFPGISNDIKKPGPGRGRVRPDAAALGCSRCSRAGRRSGPTSRRSPQPLLLLHSRVDHVVEPSNARVDPRARRSAVREEVWLEDSYHVATLDNDFPLIVARSLDFVRAHAPAAG